MKNAAPPLLPILRSRAQGDLLALLYLHPDQDYSISEAAQAIGASVKTLHPEVARLISAGFIADSRRGSLHLIRAADNAVTGPLTDLLAVTLGPLPVLNDALADIPGIREAYIFGSWAARYSGEAGPVPNDVDVLVIGTASRDELWDAAGAAEKRLHREVNIRPVDPGYWDDPNPADPFFKHVNERPLVRLAVPR
jgi:predicted nucleotidyltransferase